MDAPTNRVTQPAIRGGGAPEYWGARLVTPAGGVKPFGNCDRDQLLLILASPGHTDRKGCLDRTDSGAVPIGPDVDQ